MQYRRQGLIAQQSIILLVFFAPYVFFQFPSAVIVRKMRPRGFLPGITLLWGRVMLVGTPGSRVLDISNFESPPALYTIGKR
jgi:hypothetical protein